MAPKSSAKYYKIKKKNIPALVRLLSKELTIYGPVAHGKQYRFEEIEDPSQLRLDYDTTILPPKKYFIPPKQELFSYTRSQQVQIHEPSDQGRVSERFPDKRFILFGVHSCDLRAISFHDKIIPFLHEDPYRTKRRSEGIIIGLHCLTPCANSFCLSTGALNWEKSADLMFTDLGDEYSVKVCTDVGLTVVDAAKEMFTSGEPAQGSKVRKLLTKHQKQFPDPISSFTELPQQLEACYEGAMWKRLSERCFGCGSCTMVCPTCFCFDVQDKMNISLTKGTRVRVWDSCQLRDFAMVAGGHNFRPTILSRARFRLYHKFRIEPEQINEIGCVGCGRCTQNCPADIEITEILREIQKGGD